ncbi:aconitate hydratase [Salsuginibacillus kocurii]|uniref:aconitate hydratase n=1 Tax=Salsuginibacillus kocurii TaxID=427078 RepID=UPI00036D3B3D|nr:aconitate hydratase [Salsuginibacillus kocurii]
MGQNVTQKLLQEHLIHGELTAGEEIAIQIDQTLTQDATGTMVMLELEAMDLDQIKTEVSVQYVDHNLIQDDHKNPDDHLFLRSAAKRFGLHYSQPGNGVSHPVHMQRIAKPGKTLLGSDSHTCANGCMGMIAIGAGGIDVAMAMAGEPFYMKMPEVMGIELIGELPPRVSAKDVILELLRRHDVKGGVGKILEYHGPGLNKLTAMDRHVIANMGAELGATTSVFPADDEIKHFLHSQHRGEEWSEWVADIGASYDIEETIDLSTLEPLIAKPSSPGNVVPVTEVEGEPIYQSYIGSSANPGYRDFAVAAEIVRERQVAAGVSLDINPSSRQILQDLTREGKLGDLIAAGGRIHQAGCNGCIGMGQAPATGRNSLRTTPRNFPGRSGTKEDSVFLCSPETAAVSALAGAITDPRTVQEREHVTLPTAPTVEDQALEPPLPYAEAQDVKLEKGPNIGNIPTLKELPDEFEIPILLKVGDNISTDEILAGGARVLPYRSNLEKISEFTYEIVDPGYVERAKASKDSGGHIIVGGYNYGQGSSREHAALAPKYLGLQVVIVKDYARIHLQNLINFGVLPLFFSNPDDYEQLQPGDMLQFTNIRNQLSASNKIEVSLESSGNTLLLEHNLSARQLDLILAGGIINWVKSRMETTEGGA